MAKLAAEAGPGHLPTCRFRGLGLEQRWQTGSLLVTGGGGCVLATYIYIFLENPNKLPTLKKIRSFRTEIPITSLKI